MEDPIFLLKETYRHILASNRPLLALEAMAYCINLSDENKDTLETIARRHGVTRQTVFIEVELFRANFGLQRNGKSNE